MQLEKHIVYWCMVSWFKSWFHDIRTFMTHAKGEQSDGDTY